MNDQDIIRVASGSLIQIELWQKVLKEASIQSKVVGTELAGSLGTAIPSSVELWVHRGDQEKAEAAIRFAEQHRGEVEHEHPPHGPQKSDRKPEAPHPQHKSNRTFE